MKNSTKRVLAKCLKYIVLELDILAWTVFLIFLILYYEYYSSVLYDNFKAILESMESEILLGFIGAIILIGGLFFLVNWKLAKLQVRAEIGKDRIILNRAFE